LTIYHVQIKNHTYRVDITDNHLIIDGIKEQARLVRLNASNLFLLSRDRKNLALFLQPQDGQTYAVTADGKRLTAQVETGEGKRPSQADARQANQLRAPMPGLVVSIHVQEGDTVQPGQVLVTQESMKMQMELRSPVSGRVEKVHVQANAQVKKDDLLVSILPI
jgi:biotin carboxyl carrier protein